jgi:polysaccharide biosynthesis protein PslG
MIYKWHVLNSQTIYKHFHNFTITLEFHFFHKRYGNIETICVLTSQFAEFLMKTLILLLLDYISNYSGTIIRFIFIAALISLFTPIAIRLPTGIPSPISTKIPKLCVHTRLIDEVQEWVIQKSLEDVRKLGATTIVEFFPWAYIEGEPGRYDWTQADRIIHHARMQGLTVIARMGFVPEWARPSTAERFTTLNELPAESYDDFAAFVAAFAARYRNEVRHLIIWNEPNLSFEWGYQYPDPAQYVRLLSVVYPSVKVAQPDVTILAGALAPTIEPAGSPNALNDLLYLEGMYEAGAELYFDALAIHTYGFTDPPEAEPAFDRLNFRRAELLREIMVEYGDIDKPVFITESGWNDHPRWTLAVNPAERIAYTLDAYRWVEENWDWTQNLCLWALRYPRPTYSYPDNFTLITTEFQYKPIYYELQNAAQNGLETETSIISSSSEEQLWLPAPLDP